MSQDPATMFANRLRKNAKHRRKWASRQGVSCYRLYDYDIPEVPLIVDTYEGRLHIATYDDQPDELLDAACEALQVEQADAFVKVRRRQRGKDQYERMGREQAVFQVAEGGLRFWVNLSDYLDTGLFLDHRQTRALIRDRVAGKRVLNLFAYTGSFSVYAAAGGGLVTTVDLSATYLDWAADNLRINELPEGDLRREDVVQWLEASRERWDLIVLDPPTFSNSKRMQGTFDVQRDHRWLVGLCLERLTPGGELWFSTNARRFSMGVEAEDWTGRTVPPDFKQRRPHRCWRIVRA